MEKKKNRSALRMLVLISQLGICMMTPTFFCVFVGQFLSRRLNQELIFPFLVLLGMMADFRSCYTVITRFVNLKDNNKYSSGFDAAEDGNSTEGRKEESNSHEMDKLDSGRK